MNKTSTINFKSKNKNKTLTESIFVNFGDERFIKAKSIHRLHNDKKNRIAVNVNEVYICMASLRVGKDYVKKINGYKQILQRKDRQDIVHIHENNYVPIKYTEIVECFKEFLDVLPITAFKLIRDEKK